MEAKARRINGNNQVPVEDGRKFPTSSGIWGRSSRTRKALGKRAAKKAWKREHEVLVLADELEAQGSVDENARAIIYRGLKRIRKIREEEEALKEDRQDRMKQQEDEMWKELGESNVFHCFS